MIFDDVTGQLSGETYACALGDIYTFGPTFRAENSQTTRHLAEFNMIEPEMAFADLFSAMTNAEEFVKYVIKYSLETCKEDMAFFEKFMDKNLMTRLNKLVKEPFVRLPYRDAVVLLQEEIAKDPSKWKYPEMEFGTDFSTGIVQYMRFYLKYSALYLVHSTVSCVCCVRLHFCLEDCLSSPLLLCFSTPTWLFSSLFHCCKGNILSHFLCPVNTDWFYLTVLQHV